MAIRVLRLALLIIGTRAIWNDPERYRHISDGSDQHHFVTRPEFAAPRYVVAKHHPHAISPGYWFVSPHVDPFTTPPYSGERNFVPCGNGPHIYDDNGVLIWSGACRYQNRNCFGFNAVQVNDTVALTFYVAEKHAQRGSEVLAPRSGFILNNRYEELAHIVIDSKYTHDEHEFYLQPDGRTVIVSMREAVNADGADINQTSRQVSATGFLEIDIASDRPIFTWSPRAAIGIHVNQSCDTVNKFNTDRKKVWDFFHLNSVEKFANGDYLVSARHMHAIYRISGQNGKILWTLGGCVGNSDFTMGDGVAFHWQHNARILYEDEARLILSFFDNESDDHDYGEPFGTNPPIGKIVELNLSSRPMTATLLRRFDRPDKGQTPTAGGLQVLGPITNAEDVRSAHVFVCWSREGYISEYDGNDKLVMEARFASDRKRTYRAFKAAFKGYPTELPILKILSMPYNTLSILQPASVFYVSWNGATEVASWRFYGRAANNSSAEFSLVADASKSGFETSVIVPQHIPFAYAEAIDADGKGIGRSEVVGIELPSGASGLGNEALTFPNEGLPAAPSSLQGYSTAELLGFLILFSLAVYGLVGLLRKLLKAGVRLWKGDRAVVKYTQLPLSDL